MNLDNLLKQQSAWLRGDGPDSDVVISSRIRLARNINGFPFVGRATNDDLQRIVDIVSRVANNVFTHEKVSVIDFAKLSHEDATFLHERQLVSGEFVEADRPRTLILENDENFSVMVNEEDHLRVQSTSSGFVLQDVWAKVNTLDNLLESQLDFAFDEKFGYLTACPSNVGTGIRVSVMLHLPGLIETGEIAKVFRSLQKMNLVVRGLYGEGSRALGEFFQISNQATLGSSEETIVDQLREVVPCILSYEREARALTVEKNREGILDRCYRALGLLRSARSMSMEEAMERLSSLRLGVRMNLLDSITIDLVDELLLNIQPAHLNRLAESLGYFEDNDVLRADYLRERLEKIENGKRS